MVDELIKRTRQRMTLEEAYNLEKEIIEFLNDDNVADVDKNKLKNEGLLEPVAIAADGYKHINKLEHYKNN